MPAYTIHNGNGVTLGIIDLAEGVEISPATTQVQPTAPPAPPAPPKTEKRMTEKAAPFSYQEYLDIGWDDKSLINEGLMEEVVVDDAPGAGTVHPSAQQEPLPEEWQAEEPHVPSPGNDVPNTGTDAVGVPPVPTPDVSAASAAPPVPSPQSSVPSTPSPLPTTAPIIEGREFWVKGTSFENVQDSEGVWFDSRIHGVASDGQPALKKDGSFKKKRGLKDDEYNRILSLQKSAVSHTPVPSPEAAAATNVPPVPSPHGGGAPTTTSHQPPVGPATTQVDSGTIERLQAACRETGDEV